MENISLRAHEIEMNNAWEVIEFLFPYAEKGMMTDKDKFLNDTAAYCRYRAVQAMLQYREDEKKMQYERDLIKGEGWPHGQIH